MTIAERSKTLQRLERAYTPNEQIGQQLRRKSLVLLVGPTATGKSMIMNALVHQSPRFARISGFVTRPPRPNDEPELYRYLPHDYPTLVHICKQAKAGELVQFAVHPTTGNVYATEIHDYTGEFNCKDVMGHAVPAFRALPVQATYTFGIVCDPQQWRARLETRFADRHDPDRNKRLIEATINLEWSLADPAIIWIDNSDTNLVQAAHTIIRYTTTGEQPDRSEQTKLRATAQAMLTELPVIRSSH